MFKALRNSIILVVLFPVNIALFTLCINQLAESDKTQPAKETPIDVQAKVPRGIKHPLIHHSTQTRKLKQQLALVFNATRIHLNQAETVKLENQLERLDISPFHSAAIFSGMVYHENNLPFPQRAKLRAQNVARIIYPYTQNVKMYYRPSLEEGKVIVEFIERQKPNN